MATTAEHSLRYRSRQCDDDIVRDRHAYDTAPFLAQACPMSFEGQKQTFAPQKVMSALPTKADMCSANDDVRFGPIADIGQICEMSADRFRRPNSLVFRIRGWRRRCSLTAPPPFQPSCQSR
jgi:hypothetical protein